MSDRHAVDFWLEETAFGCRKTVRGSDWHWVQLSGATNISIEDLSLEIQNWKDSDLKDKMKNEAEILAKEIAKEMKK